MTERSPIPIFDWVAPELSVEARREFIEQIGPHLLQLIRPGDDVLDLCCGTGPVAFMLEEHGARITGIDLAPGLIAEARQEAERRGSKIEFLQADVLTHDLGEARYDAVLCLGDPFHDFPHDRLPALRDHVARALRGNGPFVIHYMDGVLRLQSRMKEPEEIVQEEPYRIRKTFKAYDPVRAAYTAEYHNLTLGETSLYTGYIHTGPSIRNALEPLFELKRSIRLDEHDFIDVYVKA
jgi:ubiquinone/menaquinone biosynthesis C-methylase UbiE